MTGEHAGFTGLASWPPRGGRFQLLDNTQGLTDLAEDVRRAQQLVPLVRRADDGAQPRLALGHRGVAHRRRENAGLKKLLREFERLRGVAYVNRDDRRLADF